MRVKVNKDRVLVRLVASILILLSLSGCEWERDKTNEIEVVDKSIFGKDLLLVVKVYDVYESGHIHLYKNERGYLVGFKGFLTTGNAPSTKFVAGPLWPASRKELDDSRGDKFLNMNGLVDFFPKYYFDKHGVFYRVNANEYIYKLGKDMKWSGVEREKVGIPVFGHAEEEVEYNLGKEKYVFAIDSGFLLIKNNNSVICKFECSGISRLPDSKIWKIQSQDKTGEVYIFGNGRWFYKWNPKNNSVDYLEYSYFDLFHEVNGSIVPIKVGPAEVDKLPSQQ